MCHFAMGFKHIVVCPMLLINRI